MHVNTENSGIADSISQKTVAGIQDLGASSRQTANCCFHRVLEPFASEVDRLFSKSAKLLFNKIKKSIFVCLFDLILYIPSTSFQIYRDMSS